MRHIALVRSYPEALDAGSEPSGSGYDTMIEAKSKSKTQIFRRKPFVEEFQLPITQLLDDFRRAT